jgi:oxalate decarboxylase/phosphoglucose isomerase-like protein (cupin superfamily)
MDWPAMLLSKKTHGRRMKKERVGMVPSTRSHSSDNRGNSETREINAGTHQCEDWG